MQADRLTYEDAVRKLAERVGMDMPDEIDDRRLMEQKRLRERIYEANREAALFYNKILFSEEGAAAQRYLENRSVTAATAKKFGLGMSPEGYDTLYKYLTEKGFSRDVLISAGLAVRGKKDPGQTYDFFRGRLMFPVISAMGKVIAFGGRTMSGEEPKYINTGDTPVYNKRENIYAINLLKGKKLDDIIMVEGYMDVISLHQHGIDNAVASLGTALTPQQAKLIKRYVTKVYYAYDGDEAGQKAMQRGIDILRASEIEPRVIVIPDGRDPDEFVKAFGAESFLNLKDASITGLRFKLERIARGHGLETPDGREKFAREACRLLTTLDPVERDRYIPVVAQMSRLSVDTVKEQCKVSKSAGDGAARTNPKSVGYRRPVKDSDRARFEQKLLACMMASPEDGLEISRLRGFSPAVFSSDAMRAFSLKLIAVYQGGGKPDISLMAAELDGEASSEISGAISEADTVVSPVLTAEDIIARLRLLSLKEELKELSAKANAETDPEKKALVMEEYKTKYVELQKLNKR
jgi:DNA primase